MPAGELFQPRIVREDELPAPNVLLVDDIDANLIALEAALSPLRCRLVYARSGSDALAHLLREEFALILMDVQMPEMDGYETARLVRARRKTQHIPIIFLTAHDHDYSGVRRAYDLGAVDFLSKPLDVDVLRAKAQAFIALHERTLEVAELRAERAMNEERARQEAESLKREMERLAASDRRKTEFLATLAAELRGPISPLRTSLVLLGAPSLDDAVRSQLRVHASEQLAELTRVVDDLVDVSAIAADQVVPATERVDLAAVIERALFVIEPAVTKAQLSLVVQAPAEPVAVEVDPGRMVQVIANLLEHAVRQTPTLGTIRVEWGSEYGHAFVRVVDTGRGLSATALDSIFDLSGHGIGLPLAKQLVELHRGTIRAKSAGEGRGTTFEVRLKAAQFPLVAARKRGATGPIAIPRALRTLIVDRDEDMCEMTARLFTGRGHQALIAVDARSALAMIAEHRPDVALVDLDLPGIHGEELVRLARTVDPKLPTKFVALTDGSDDAVARAKAAGFTMQTSKPISSSAFVVALELE